jgi:peptidoglycan/xylan/chitin deacetylase (PgdA/CDA1 family)
VVTQIKRLATDAISNVYYRINGPATNGRRVLMYHSIDREEGDGRAFTVSKSNFEKQMSIIKQLNIPVVDLMAPLEKGLSIAITFDDGYRDNLEIALPVLQKYKFPATVFVSTGMLDTEELFLSSPDLRELSKFFQVGSHGSTHRPLTQLTPKEQVEELERSKAILENKIGRGIDCMSFPHGRYNEPLVAIAKSFGYRHAATSNNNINSELKFLIARTCILNRDSPEVFKAKVFGSCDWRSSKYF